jgi:2-oxoglutarate dehydrogenase E1 component
MTAESKSPTPQKTSPNAVMEATAFLFGTNAGFIEGLYAQYLSDPSSVDGAWRAFFDALGEQGLSPAQLGRGPSWRRDAKLGYENGELISALTGDWPAATPGKKPSREAAAAPTETSSRASAQAALRAMQLVRAYRINGHLEADLDPLGLEKKKPMPQLQPSYYGYSEADLDKPIFIDNVMGLELATPRQLVEILRRTYCGHIGYEYMHITDLEQRQWLQTRIEGADKKIAFTPEGKRAILNKLIEAEVFEKFCGAKFVTTKRFGIDGGESAIPALEQVIKRGGALGVKDIVLGMPHRGRLNVLANVMSKPYRQIFHEFQGGSAKPSDVQGSGDVKYHLGASSDRAFDGKNVHLSFDREPFPSRSGRSGGFGQGTRQAVPIWRQGHARDGDPAADAWRRSLRRPGRGCGMLRHVGNEGLPDRRHAPLHRQQPDRVHDRARLCALLALPIRRRADGAGAHLPRERR